VNAEDGDLPAALAGAFPYLPVLKELFSSDRITEEERHCLSRCICELLATYQAIANVGVAMGPAMKAVLDAELNKQQSLLNMIFNLTGHDAGATLASVEAARAKASGREQN
jgi:hypothetical protein